MPEFKPATPFEAFIHRKSQQPGFLAGFWQGRVLSLRQKRSVAEFKRRLQACRPGDVLVDLGANVGKLTRMMAVTGAEVHAYEPDPATFEWLKKNCSDFGNIVFHNKAVGATSGTVHLRRHKNYWRGKKAASVASTVVFSDPAGYEQSTIPVEQVAFADLLAGLPKPARIIKMDIEGAEFGILRDIFARQDFAGLEALFVETHERVDTALIDEVEAWRCEAEGLRDVHICLYWP